MASVVRFVSLFFVVLLAAVVVEGGARSDLAEEATDRRLESLRKDLLRARKHTDEAKEVGESRSLTDILDGLNQDTDDELVQKKSDAAEFKGLNAVGDDDDDDDDDDEIGGSDVSDGIFYTVIALADEIKAICDIDIAAIFSGFSPATLAGANDASTKLGAATKALSDVLASSPGFADDLKTFADSSAFKASDLPANIDKTFAQIDKTLSSVENKVFCSQAQLIATRLQMTLYGGVGFANGYLCNKVFVELLRYHLNATKLLEASTSEEDFVKNCTKNLVEDITCYEKELEAYNKILPTAPFTAASPLQTAAFTADFMIDYGIVLMYHRVVLQLEAEVIKLCAAGDKDHKDDDNDVDRAKKEKAEDTVDEDTESLTDQLQRLLKKLNEASTKKKEAQLHGGAFGGRTGVHAKDQVHESEGTAINSNEEDGDDTGSKAAVDVAKMPSAGDKTAIKKSYYREREN